MAAYVNSSAKQEWINEAVQSVQNQTFTDWELIIVDDASPFSINLDVYDERIRMVRTVNRSGPSLCRNDASALAKFDCLLPLDADDLLADNDTLRNLFVVWKQRQNEIIYGDLQQLIEIDGIWREGKSFDLPEYTFEKAMLLEGIIPVTAMHSKACHLAAGGWKGQLSNGLEDVEYWISAGKAGFCGHRVPGIVLKYRKHLDSRSYLLRENRQEGVMRNLIKELHQDIYSGRYPMGCCGGGKPYTPPTNGQSERVVPPSMLGNISVSEKVWVEYAGAKQGSFGAVGQSTGINYTINGPGHKFEVHVKDLPIFQRQRGVNGKPAFIVGTNAPVIIKNEPAFKAQEPELAQILEL
jgi:hypothetical protein